MRRSSVASIDLICGGGVLSLAVIGGAAYWFTRQSAKGVLSVTRIPLDPPPSPHTLQNLSFLRGIPQLRHCLEILGWFSDLQWFPETLPIIPQWSLFFKSQAGSEDIMHIVSWIHLNLQQATFEYRRDSSGIKVGQLPSLGVIVASRFSTPLAVRLQF